MEEIRRKNSSSPESELPKDYYRPSIDRLRFILMFFLSIQLLGFPTQIGGYVQILCGFVPISFFIISGYLVLRDDEDRSQRILRTLKRTAITFGVLVVAYVIINIFYYNAIDVNMFEALTSKRTWFNFIVLNIWPFDIGGSIWFVQAMLYAYIIIFILDKLNLLRFDWVFFIICIVITLVTGEFSGIIGFNVLDYKFIAGNFVTRALPYILLGNIIHRNRSFFNRIHRSWYGIAIVAGAAFGFFEIFLLNKLGVEGYYGHLIGMPIMGISTCMLAIKDRKDLNHIEKRLIPSRKDNVIIYYICQPVGIGISVLLVALIGSDAVNVAYGFISVLAFLISYAVALAVGAIRRKLRHQHHRH